MQTSPISFASRGKQKEIGDVYAQARKRVLELRNSPKIWQGVGGALLENPHPISDQKVWFSLLYFRPDPKFHTLFQTCPGTALIWVDVPYPIPDKLTQTLLYFRPKWSKSLPYFRLKRLKTILFAAPHTYLAYISPSPHRVKEFYFSGKGYAIGLNTLMRFQNAAVSFHRKRIKSSASTLSFSQRFPRPH